MSNKQHSVHKFRRVDIGVKSPYYVMQCLLPGCNHQTPMKSRLSCPLLMGKIAFCNRCSSPFELDKRSLRMVNPCCESCVKRKVNLQVDKVDEFFKGLENSLKE